MHHYRVYIFTFSVAKYVLSTLIESKESTYDNEERTPLVLYMYVQCGEICTLIESKEHTPLASYICTFSVASGDSHTYLVLTYTEK